MTTIKNYTDIEQSCKLAEILPLESADGHWFNGYLGVNYRQEAKDFYDTTNNEYIPAWSLTALLGVLPKDLNIGRPSLESNYKEYYWIQYYDEFMNPKNYKTECFNNPVDACVAMIEKLHELKML